jgi:carbonic anhydrase
MSSATRLKKRIEANVLLQVQNLRTHPFIAEREARGELESRGWVYEIGSGEVRAYSAETERIETVE